MKIGDKVRCTFSINETFTVGKEYGILGFDSDGDPTLKDNEGDWYRFVGYPLNGGLWKFEVVTND